MRAAPASASLGAVRVRVSGNELVNGAGRRVRLLGVDRSGTEYACVQGWGIFDGPSNAASVTAIASWHADAVRVPLNEDCWLGINGVSPAYSGTAYRSAIVSYVDLLNAYGIVAVLDLHWNAPGGTLATGQEVMADASHSPAFWSSVASTFRSNPGVVFDLYNEPHTISWTCWLDGCVTPGGWQAAGMQSLVDAVRATGATQPLMLGGLGWAGTLSGWLAHEPIDPLHQLVASVHVYNFSGCATLACWQSTIAPVAARVPVVTGELGDNVCTQAFIDSYMSWADANGVSYLGWAWDAGGGWTCTGGPSLITGYTGAPTAMGAGLQQHLLTIAAHTPTLTVATGTGQGAGAPTHGYWLGAADGGVFSYDAAFFGSAGALHLAKPIVGMAAAPTGGGYWLVGADGGVFSYDAPFFGSAGALHLAAPIVGMAADPVTHGYWLVGADGGVFSYDAPFFGSAGALHLAKPIVGMAAAPTGGGYWLVGADGGVFSYGTAGFFGSAAALHLAAPIVGMAADPATHG